MTHRAIPAGAHHFWQVLPSRTGLLRKRPDKRCIPLPGTQGLCDRLTTCPWKKNSVIETRTKTQTLNIVRGESRAPQRRLMKLCKESRTNPVKPTTLLKPMKKKHFLIQKAAFNLGTWNVRTLLEPGRYAQIAKEMANYKLQILGMSEVRWNTFGETRLQSGETLLFSGKEKEDNLHENGVALLLNKEAFKSLLEWEPVSVRIIRAKFLSKLKNVHIIMCYAPTNLASDTDKNTFYD
uniref:Endonuclease/exonuclease/phosphatase domain-containing protein n=1 Tax=Biomphalaria glabrata TaxID=6526 RepID=A0A2C9KLM5_BIOGL